MYVRYLAQPGALAAASARARVGAAHDLPSVVAAAGGSAVVDGRVVVVHGRRSPCLDIAPPRRRRTVDDFPRRHLCPITRPLWTSISHGGVRYLYTTRMWASAQRDGRPADCRI